ncbi:MULTISPECIES: sulfite exporter TauE/SafE family protein [unclassified Rhodococcus (in: high G+C Gram-positive bacteria)]|uniref:sulfite exporter TauE/SafE family protein n=1 Tax=unclassified Rhodococcus (in: high G+C Gram-positive bacteria) TaxID=192944 RepID=UPI0006FB3873|nr:MULTISPECIES: sulfite exporter TauE/SafE family protein [unclassified Rhodococcus (in: high G+C Gram-positive bacteria)]KQU36457.1 permease [Rhodococcus sp. Leaf225]KQU49004.1 permease [Rhodococcus sp. Leaf258]
MTGLEWLVVGVAIFTASCLQSSIGFGMGMVAAPVLAIIDPRMVPGTIILLATALTALVVVRERTSIDVRGAGWALVGRVPGVIAGAALLVVLPERGVSIMLGAVVLFGVVATAIGWSPTPRRGSLMTAGAASGLLGTATSIGGPPMALIWSGSSGAALRSTMSGFFLIGSLMSLAALGVAGSLDAHSLATGALLLPVVALGYMASRWVNRVLDRRRLRWVSIVVSAGGALVLLVDAVV